MKEKTSEKLSRLWPEYFGDCEVWKDVVGREGHYKISSLGRLKSMMTGKILDPYKNKHGYMVTFLRAGGAASSFQIHRLVATAFIPNPESKSQVNHINGDKSDNRVENLEWCTPAENITHGISIGLINPKAQSSKKVAQIKDGQIVKIYNSTSELSNDGFDRRLVYQCINGKGRRKTHKGYSWQFIN